MSPLQDDDRRGLLILDTGPIHELLLHRAVFHFGFEKLRPKLQWLTTPASYNRCSELIASFRRKMTSAYVVSELNYWIRKTEDKGQAKLWYRAYSEFRDMGMTEEVTPLLAMDIDMVAHFGPTDASLIELATLHQSEDPVVLTVDRKLCGHCLKVGLGVRLLQEL